MKRGKSLTRRRRSSKTAGSRRVRPQFLNAGNDQVETNVTYWVIHATHWCAFLFIVIVILAVGKTLFAAAP